MSDPPCLSCIITATRSLQCYHALSVYLEHFACTDEGNIFNGALNGGQCLLMVPSVSGDD